MTLTAAGDQLLGYARRMVAMNDEVVARLTDQAFEGEISLGVPHDIVYPVIPRVLQQLHAAYPRMKVHMKTSYSSSLREDFARGDLDLILTTELTTGEGAETLARRPLAWIGAPGGTVWRQRPLRVAFERHCSFRPPSLAALERAGIEWETAVETESDRTIEATVSADLAINTMIAGTEPAHLEQIPHGGSLPELPIQMINLYTTPTQTPPVADLTDMLRRGFTATSRGLETAA